MPLEVPPDLLAALRQGGFVIYFRHAATDWDQQDRERSLMDVASCDPNRMRQLSDSGRETARRIGMRIRGLGIPVDSVVASEYCRTVETANLLDLGPVTTSRDVINERVAERVGGRDHLRDAVRKRLATIPRPGFNSVIVAHGNVFLLAAGTRPPEAGAAIVRPLPGGRFDVVAMFAPDDWDKLRER